MRPVDPRLLRYARSTRALLAATVAPGLAGAGLVVAQAMLIAGIVVGAFQHHAGLDRLADDIADPAPRPRGPNSSPLDRPAHPSPGTTHGSPPRRPQFDHAVVTAAGKPPRPARAAATPPSASHPARQPPHTRHNRHPPALS